VGSIYTSGDHLKGGGLLGGVYTLQETGLTGLYLFINWCQRWFCPIFIRSVLRKLFRAAGSGHDILISRQHNDIKL
jgi:hypothetical protein